MIIRTEGLIPIAVASGVSWLASRTRIGVLGYIPAAFVLWFFRDPVRAVPQGKGLVLSPADGRVIGVEKTTESRVGACTKVSIFMSVFNVHVNRSPVNGQVIEKIYRPGTFHMANMGKKTQDNERVIIYIRSKYGIIRVDQVAGMVARRIVCWKDAQDRVDSGERIGLIKFGSLLECYVPEWMDVSSMVGDRVFAGQTILGRVQE
ncbi:MAG: phosphatidylserine decarboxylase [Thermodesulfobacteriota bacterium]|nr:phosphatidylserine decarboxylase [Thermodesulfobacteriota bacterium]